MKKRKTIIAAIVLLCVFLVGGAIAYFTDTDTKTNTFTIGNIDITLSEPSWSTTDSDQNGVPDAAENLMPGQTLAKDPTITNDSTNNAAYVFAKVEIPCSSDATPLEVFELRTIGSGWTLMTDGACTSGKATKIYNYGTASAMTSLAAGSSTTPVFSVVAVNNGISSDSGLTGNQNVVVTGYGIQADGLGSSAPSAVWTDLNS